jgi:SecD/SecF fusion protein
VSDTTSKNLAGRWFLTLLITGLAVLAWVTKISDAKPWGLTLGQDLRGGTTLRFALDIAQARREGRVPEGETDAELVEQTIKVIETRVNRFGLAEVALTPVGDDKFEISLPADVDPESVKAVVSALGELQFRIEVLPSYPEFSNERGDKRTRLRVWEGADGVDADGKPVHYEADQDGFDAFKKAEVDRWREAREKAKEYKLFDKRYRLVQRERPGAAPGSVPTNVADFAVLEEPSKPEQNFGGKSITDIKPGPDERNRPGVHYNIKVDYQKDFGDWTEENIGLPMAIVLNEEVHSAPRINSRLDTSVVISLGGGGFGARETERLENEAKQLVAILQSGSLKIKPDLEGTSTVGATLAGEAVKRGVLSTAVAFGLVLLYMIVYYFTAGFIANVALLLNLVLTVGAMAYADATLTLPGIAGIVLTLGMAVDANILVYERIREEQNRGRDVHKAVSEGFARAFTTIVDSNVTTLFTAVFLFQFGAGSIKGFAVTLALGLIASMFTAVFVTRTIFETWLKSGRVKRIGMLGTGRPPSIRWMHLRRYFIPSSILLMLAGIALFAVSPRSTVYDIDFTGGMKLQARFDRPTSIEEVKNALESGPRTVRIERDVARGEGVGSMDVQAGPYPGAEVVTVGTAGTHVEVRVPLAKAGTPQAALREREQIDAFKGYAEQALAGRLVPAWVRKKPAPYVSTGENDPHKAYAGRLFLQIALEDPANALTAQRLEDAFLKRMPWFEYAVEGRRREARQADLIDRQVDVADAAPTEGAAAAAGGHVKVYDVWWRADRKGTTDQPLEDDPARLEADLREFLSGAPFRRSVSEAGAGDAAATQVVLADPFPMKDLIGAGVAQRLRNNAMLALLLSFVAIIVYVAFRFRSYAMGFSAVLCLIHDVLIALGFVCLVDNLGIVDAKISLGLVAAFLTIVGYSVNDTVVTFDRIRELRGKAPRITTRMIEDAVNQTFSRTLRTTATVLLTVVVLFALNLGQRSMLEGLSFTLLVGVTSGGYSTIGVASPLLLFLPWFWAKARKYRPRLAVITWPANRTGTYVLAGASVAALVLAWVVSHDWILAVFYGLLVAPLMLTVGAWVLWLLVFAAACFVVSSVLLIPWSFHEDPEAAAHEAHKEIGADLAAQAAASQPPGAPREPPRSASYGKRPPEEPDEE